MSTCSSCAHARIIPQDITKRGCRGSPPQIVVMPTPKGPQVQNLFPVVGAMDEACGAYKQKILLPLDTSKPN